MNFLSPWFLAGALLVIGPIVAHLIRRSTRDRTTFSATRFLDESAPRLQRRSRVQHPLLLLLRCLIIALLAAAFARPFFAEPSVSPASGSPTQEVVIVLDDSASMRRSGVWQEAQQSVYDLVSGLRAFDRCTVFLASGNLRSVMTAEQWLQLSPDGRLQNLQSVLATREPTWGPSYLDSAIDGALDAFSEDAANSSRKRLIVVSDFAVGSRISGLAGREWPAGLEISLLRTSAPLTNNAGLQWLGWTDPGSGPRQARVRITRDRGALPLPLKLQLFQDVSGEAVGTPVNVELAPGETRVVTLPAPPDPNAPLRALLSGDAEAFDNNVWLPPPALDEVPIVYLGNHDAADAQNALFYVSRALGSARGAKLDLVTVNPTSPPEQLPAAALFVVNAPLPPAMVETVRARLAQGTHVLTLLGSPELLTTAAALAGEQDWVPRARGDRYALFGRIDFNHPLFAAFADPRFSDFSQIRFWRPTALQLPATTRSAVAATFDDDSPAIIETIVGRGRHLAFASDWSPRASQWVLSTKFVPWLQALVERASGGPARPQSADIANLALLSTSPNATWSAADRQGERQLDAPPFTPGVYRLTENTTARWVAIQVPPEESRTDALPLDAFEQLGVPLKAPAARGDTAALSNTTPDAAAVATESRQKLWRWLLLTTAALLAAESAFALFISKREAAPTPATGTA